MPTYGRNFGKGKNSLQFYQMVILTCFLGKPDEKFGRFAWSRSHFISRFSGNVAYFLASLLNLLSTGSDGAFLKLPRVRSL